MHVAAGQSQLCCARCTRGDLAVMVAVQRDLARDTSTQHGYVYGFRHRHTTCALPLSVDVCLPARFTVLFCHAQCRAIKKAAASSH